MTKQHDFKAALKELKQVSCGDTAMNWFEEYANHMNPKYNLVYQALERAQQAQDDAFLAQDLIKRLNITSSMIIMCEPIAFGSDAALMIEAAKFLERHYLQQPEKGNE